MIDTAYDERKTKEMQVRGFWVRYKHEIAESVKLKRRKGCRLGLQFQILSKFEE